MNFTGWCREGYWSIGTLLNGKNGRTVNLAKFLVHKPQEGDRAKQALNQMLDSLALTSSPLKATAKVDGYVIPVFMESHV